MFITDVLPRQTWLCFMSNTEVKKRVSSFRSIEIIRYQIRNFAGRTLQRGLKIFRSDAYVGDLTAVTLAQSLSDSTIFLYLQQRAPQFIDRRQRFGISFNWMLLFYFFSLSKKLGHIEKLRLLSTILRIFFFLRDSHGGLAALHCDLCV